MNTIVFLIASDEDDATSGEARIRLGVVEVIVDGLEIFVERRLSTGRY